MQPDSGTIDVLGQPPASGTMNRAALERIGASIDGPAIYTHLSAFDNLLVHARLTGVGRARIEKVLDIVGLASTGRKRARHFSMGMKARLALGVAILAEADSVEAARARLMALVEEAAVPPKPRIATRPGRAADARRRDAKSRRASLKSGRGRPALD